MLYTGDGLPALRCGTCHRPFELCCLEHPTDESYWTDYATDPPEAESADRERLVQEQE